MVDEVTDPSLRRRMMLRRARGGGGSGSSFGSGISTSTESFRGTDAPDEIGDEPDRAIDPDQQRAAVQQRALPAPQADAAGEDGPDHTNPRQRLNQVAQSGSATYAREYRLVLLHRLLMRNVPLDQIANQLQVSITTVERDRVALKAFLRERASQLDINEIVGEQNAMYDEVAGMALRMASAQGTPAAMKLASMRTALAANADRTRLLNTAGVFDVLRFKPPSDNASLSDIQTLMQRTEQALLSLDAEDPQDEPEAPVQRRITRKRGGFAPMTFDDSDASGSSREVDSI